MSTITNEIELKNCFDASQLFEFKQALQQLTVDEHCYALLEAFQAGLLPRAYFLSLLIIAAQRLSEFTLSVSKTKNNAQKQTAIRGHIAMRKIMKVLSPYEVSLFSQRINR